jgi:ribosomal protein S18 acetylase RimI-like enzyme
MGREAGEVLIRPASAADIPGVRAMLLEYAAWIDLDLAYQEFEAELDHLPGDYAPPTGALLVAEFCGGEISSLPRRSSDEISRAKAGVIALRRRDAETCEMKRLYVRPAARGQRLGEALVHRLLDEARRRGYRTIVLDTLPAMRGAQALYERLGFKDIPPYYDTPIVGTRFMAKEL